MVGRAGIRCRGHRDATSPSGYVALQAGAGGSSSPAPPTKTPDGDHHRVACVPLASLDRGHWRGTRQRPERIELRVLALWPPRTGFIRPVGAADAVKHSLALLINQACEQLLREPEHKRPGKNLCGRV
jgi:hypothetical protein